MSDESQIEELKKEIEALRIKNDELRKTVDQQRPKFGHIFAYAFVGIFCGVLIIMYDMANRKALTNVTAVVMILILGLLGACSGWFLKHIGRSGTE